MTKNVMALETDMTQSEPPCGLGWHATVESMA